jgi:hypothetical protein
MGRTLRRPRCLGDLDLTLKFPTSDLFSWKGLSPPRRASYRVLNAASTRIREPITR